MKTSLESTAARPSLSITRTSHLMRSSSAKKSVMPSSGFFSSRGEVRASSRMRLAFCALVVHTFWPCTTQRPSFFSARVRMREVSTPAVGSVTPKAISISPRAILARYLSFIALEPWRRIGCGGNT